MAGRLGLESPSLRKAAANWWRDTARPARRLRFLPGQLRSLLGRPVPYQGFRMFIHPGDPIISYDVAVKGEWAPAEMSLLRRIVRPGDTVLDAGANIGCHTLPLSRLVGPAGRVFAVEPEPANARKLRRNVEENGLANVTVAEVALSDRAGEVELAVARRGNRGLHSLAPANLRRGRHGSVRVPCETVDGLLERHGVARLDAMKLDVQGAEWLVAAGAGERLARDRPAVLTEMCARFLRATGGSPAALLDPFLGLGYRVFRLNDATGGLVPEDAAALLALEDEVNLLLWPPGRPLPALDGGR